MNSKIWGLISLASVFLGNPAMAAKPNAFGLAPKNENFVYAPYGVEGALAIVALGAKGETETEIFRVFPDLRKPNTAVSTAKGKDFRLSIGNSAWIKSTFTLLPNYAADLRAKFGAEITALEFRDAAGDAAKMNAWVSKNTAGKITSIIDPAKITKDLRLILINTLYFKAKWDNPFKADMTRADDFQPTTGKVYKVDYMHQTDTYSVLRRGSYDTVILPYAGQQQTLWLTLPHAGIALAKIEDELEETALEKRYAADRKEAKSASVQLSLPKFSVASEFSLAPYLRKRGIEKLFNSGAADLGGISNEKPLFISDIVQKAVLDLDEEGTEAAAATAAMMMLGAALREERPFVMNFDRPFAYFLRDEKSGKILFMGRMARPPEAKIRK